MTRRGITIVELLTVVAIIAALAAILFPVLGSAKERGYQERCSSNLRQLHLAVTLYQGEWNGNDQGDMFQMGLPSLPFAKSFPKYREFIGACSAVPNRRITTRQAFPYLVAFDDYRDLNGNSAWSHYVARQGSNAVLFIDANHNPASTSLTEESAPQTGFAVTYGGNVRHLVKPGSPADLSWWE